MASAAAPDPTLSDNLECPVCLLTFNLTDRCPKALVCHHTICGQCLDALKKPTIVKCPTCREDGDVSKVATNYAVMDVLRALCEECTGQKHSGTCDHCRRQLCQSCTEAHAENVHGELLKTLDRVDQELADANRLYNDDTAVSEQHRKESEAIREIKDEMRRRRKAIDELEAKLIGSVASTMKKNVGDHDQWVEELGAEITKVSNYKRKTRSIIGFRYSGRVAVSEMMALKDQGEEALVAITRQKSHSPAMEEYEYNKQDFTIPSRDVTTMTEVATTQSTVSTMTSKPSQTAASTMTEAGPIRSRSTVATITEVRSLSRGEAEPDYTTLRHVACVGSQGAGCQDFDGPFDAVCVSNMIVVADYENHRLKWYDRELSLLFTVGEKGSKQGQFCNPVGLAVTSDDELLVSDVNNHRVVMLSKNGKYITHFGKYGTKDDELYRPLGLASRGDHTYICDAQNYRVKNNTTDGKFVQHIGGKGTVTPGQYENLPIRVAVMSPGDGRILVAELKKPQLHVYDSRGVYLGLFPPTIPPQLTGSLPSDVTVDRYDNVLMSYVFPGRLGVYDQTGRLLTLYWGPGTGDGQFDGPRGVAVNTREGFLVVCDYRNNRLQKLAFDRK